MDLYDGKWISEGKTVYEVKGAGIPEIMIWLNNISPTVLDEIDIKALIGKGTITKKLPPYRIKIDRVPTHEEIDNALTSVVEEAIVNVLEGDAL